MSFVNVIPESHCKCFDCYHEAGGGPFTECILVIVRIISV